MLEKAQTQEGPFQHPTIPEQGGASVERHMFFVNIFNLQTNKRPF